MLKTFYPEIAPREEPTFIKTKDGKHELYIAKYGNPNGIPVIMLHGGPGSGSTPKFPRYFDPEKYNIIVYDQRGGAKSKPLASIEANTAQYLVEDLEHIRRETLGENTKAVIWGGSWGATLALLYAKKYPQHVSALILRGIFQGRFEDGIAFVDDKSAAAIKNPEEWRKLKSYIFAADEIDQPHTPEEIVTALYEKIKGDDYEEVARAFSAWERWNSYEDPILKKEARDGAATDPSAKSMGRIEIYYLFHKFFIENESLFKNLELLKDIPIWVIQGIFDDVCPKYQAEALIAALNEIGNTKVTVKMTQGGHSAADPANVHALIEAGIEYDQMYCAPKVGDTKVRTFDGSRVSDEAVVTPSEKLERNFTS